MYQPHRFIPFIAGVLLIILSALPCQAEVAVSPTGMYTLTDFGPVLTGAQAQATLDTACAWIREHGGGTVIVPPGTHKDLVIRNHFQTHREDTKHLVTIIDYRNGVERVYPPQVGMSADDWKIGWVGQRTERVLDTYPDYLPHWGAHTMADMKNTVLRGSSSVLRYCDVRKVDGEVRMYPATIRGIFPKQRLSFTMPGVSENIEITDIRWDPEQRRHYCLTSLNPDKVTQDVRGQFSNKNNVGVLYITTNHNADSQSFDFLVNRNQYGHGDTFLISGWYAYQGDIMSARGDENGVVFNAEIEQDVAPFTGTVEAMDWDKNALVYQPGADNADKLATSRPIINLNKEKWLTRGTVKIVPPEDWSGMLVANPAYKDRAAEIANNGIAVKDFPLTYQDNGKTRTSLTTWHGKPVRELKYVYQGRAYPSIIHSGINWMGGRIIGSADCGWTEDVVGRFFAIDEPSEYFRAQDGGGYFTENPRGITYRWYHIRAFTNNPDGTCEIRIERVRQAAIAAGAPTLYSEENYTWDGHERPLKYIIAPGAFAADIAEGWFENMFGKPGKTHPRTVGLAPAPVQGTAFDFAPGDPITQGIGADPTLPKGLRIRQFNKTPSSMPGGAIEIMNNGIVSTHAALIIAYDGPLDRDVNLARRKDHKPAHENGILIEGLTGAGIRFGADVVEGALVFEQPYHEQPLKWYHAQGATELAVNVETGEMRVTGGDITLPTLKGLSGLSATATAANNLRGIDVPVSNGRKQVEITFATPEPDEQYSITVQPNWFTQDRVVKKTAKGFVVEFSTAAPKDAVIDWQLIR